ncbi:hypothetical protein GCM10011419_30170 [Vogesella fluminis]|uniref:Uncharacterized protein n=1 Tax=Vogesella fluminis TaxID=1069161 RepID=A0ABQ2W9J9_9NEIS|nr:hypothetical protein GCM10011419_30170 [Vogesella fluminis]
MFEVVFDGASDGQGFDRADDEHPRRLMGWTDQVVALMQPFDKLTGDLLPDPREFICRILEI